MSNIKSILIANDYLICCKTNNKNCCRSILARKYLSYRVSREINKKRNTKLGSIFIYLLGLILIK